MITPAFSTVACPNWTLDKVAASAKSFGYSGVELRTFGDGSLKFSCDPVMTGAEKVRAMFRDAGISIVSLATSLSFHQAIDPPVIGHAICDNEVAIRAARRAIDLAASIECPLVRVFGFQVAGPGGRVSTSDRIAERLKLVVDHAQHTGVRVMIETGGDFNTAVEIMEIIDKVGGPLLGVCYNALLGQREGESSAAAVNVLGNRLFALRLKNVVAGRPVLLDEPGEGDARAAFAAVASTGIDVPAIFEWDRAWMPEIAEPEAVLPQTAKLMFSWLSPAGNMGAPNSADSRSARLPSGVPTGFSTDHPSSHAHA